MDCFLHCPQRAEKRQDPELRSKLTRAVGATQHLEERIEMHLEPDLVVAMRLYAVFGEECGLVEKPGQYLPKLRTDDRPPVRQAGWLTPRNDWRRSDHRRKEGRGMLSLMTHDLDLSIGVSTSRLAIRRQQSSLCRSTPDSRPHLHPVPPLVSRNDEMHLVRAEADDAELRQRGERADYLCEA